MYNRKSIRLRNHDYSGSGFYFLTMCTWHRICIFGDVIEGQVQLNDYGKIVLEELHRSTKIRKEIDLDVFTIMPNHIHAIIIINNDCKNTFLNHNNEINTLINRNYENSILDRNNAGSNRNDVWVNSNNAEVNRNNVWVNRNDVWVNSNDVWANPNNVGANPNNVGANGRSPQHMKPKSLSSFVAGFKSIVTSRINELRNMPGHPVWQRNYYEHIIRDEKSLQNIRQYILNNPLQWDLDSDNPVIM